MGEALGEAGGGGGWEVGTGGEAGWGEWGYDAGWLDDDMC